MITTAHTERIDREKLLSRGPWCVEVVDGVATGTRVVLSSGQIRVGSNPKCDLRIPHCMVAPFHLSVRLDPMGVHIKDLGSRSGTLYLGTKLGQVMVTNEALLAVGHSWVRVAPLADRPRPRGTAYHSFGSLVGGTPAMLALYRYLEQLKCSDAPVIIEGETGVGKELVAREVHRVSNRSAEPFEVLDCGSLSTSLAESELFGHVPGAFTNAVARHVGIFERADRGSVFLDELGELPLSLQPKLLRVLETGELRPVGSARMRQVSVRIICATNRNLHDEMQRGRFREDLYYRVNGARLHMPPLRERREDIPHLIEHFLHKLNARQSPPLPQRVKDHLVWGYHWPGNVRELRNVIATYTVLHQIPLGMLRPVDAANGPTDLHVPLSEARRARLKAFERDYFGGQLQRCHNNVAEAARRADIHPSVLRRKIKRLGLARTKIPRETSPE